MKTEEIVSSIKIVALATILAFGMTYVYAWTSAPASPPNSNVSAPINVSATAQTKSGNFTANKFTAPTYCIGSDCISAWPSGGGGGITGSGSSGYIPKWTSSTALGNSIISTSGSDVTIAGSVLNMTNSNSKFYGDGVNTAVRMNSGDFHVQNSSGSANKNVFANDYYISTLGKWVSQLGGQNSCAWQKFATHGGYICPAGKYVAGVCLTNSNTGCGPIGNHGGGSTQSTWEVAGGVYCCSIK